MRFIKEVVTICDNLSNVGKTLGDRVKRCYLGNSQMGDIIAHNCIMGETSSEEIVPKF